MLHSGFRGRNRLVDLDLLEIQSADKDTIGIILSWLDGYYKDQDDPPVIDTDQFVANAKKLGEYCSDHPDQGLITAAE